MKGESHANYISNCPYNKHVLFVAKLKNDSIATNASLQIAQGLAWAVIAVCNWNDGHRASVVFFAGMSLISFKKGFQIIF